jgi:drug/metabolite transporter (DMT)-like permease
MDEMSREWLGLVLGLVGVIVFGGSLPMTKLAVSGFEPGFVTFVRPAGAGLVALAVLLALRRRLPPRDALWPLVVSSLALVWGWPGLTNFAMKTVPAAHGGVVAGLLPLTTAAAAALIIKDRQPLEFWGFAVAGAVLVIGFALHDNVAGLTGGDGLLLIAVVICAVGYVAAGNLSKRMPSWEVVSWMLVVSLPFALAGTAWTWPATGLSAPPMALFGLGYITLLSQYLGFFAWNMGLAMGGVARVSQVQLVQTFVTLSFAALLLAEPVAPTTWMMALLVVMIVAGAQAVARRAKSHSL